MAKASGAKLGKVVSLVEGSGGYYGGPLPVYKAVAVADSMSGMGGGGSVAEPGSSYLTKSVTVVFELK